MLRKQIPPENTFTYEFVTLSPPGARIDVYLFRSNEIFELFKRNTAVPGMTWEAGTERGVEYRKLIKWPTPPGNVTEFVVCRCFDYVTNCCRFSTLRRMFKTWTCSTTIVLTQLETKLLSVSC